MTYDLEKVDDVILALLWLNSFEDPDGFGTRAWKGFTFAHMDRLYEKGLIGDPKSKAKSVVLTSEGGRRGEALFESHFGK